MFEKYKRSLPFTQKSKDYLDTLPSLYCLYKTFKDGFIILEWKNSGRCNETGIPLVWKYEDFNGECPIYLLTSLAWTHAQPLFAWSTNKGCLENIIKLIEENNTPRYDRRRK